ncbi:S49 family peptidase [Micrococcales bacterium 31B]|nr:S49 family peptidase [Micrococcales bacterium 31B]
MKALREQLDPHVVPVVMLNGVISPNAKKGQIDAESVDRALEHAFKTKGAKAVALYINSPGGSPTQSLLIGRRVRELAAKHELPVHAFCADVAASGGYWLACAADDITAAPTSIVGSVGVISGGFGVVEALGKLGLEYREQAAGANKSRLSPFKPTREEDLEWQRGLLGEMHQIFIAWVRERRGDRLQGSDEEVFNADVWLGERALELGIIDAVGTVREELKRRYGSEVKLPVIATKKSRLQELLGASAEAAIDAVATVADNRALWARFRAQ